MAERKSPQTAPVLDATCKKGPLRNIIVQLPPDHYANVIRGIRTGTSDTAMSVRTATHATLKRLGVKRDKGKAPKRTPKGSDQFSTGALIEWLNRVKPTDKKAVAQVVKIDACACERTA